MQKVYHLIDKSSYKNKVAASEPDAVYWNDGPYHCLILRNKSMGHLCGYVSIPSSHPHFPKNNNDTGDGFPEYTLPYNVHGGLTFSGNLDLDDALDGIFPIDKEYFIGFDCAHSGDSTPGVEASFALLKDKLGADLFSFLGSGTYRDLDYVIDQADKLLRQIKSFA